MAYSFLLRWQACFYYFTLPVFMGRGSKLSRTLGHVRKVNKQSKGENSYLTVEKSRYRYLEFEAIRGHDSLSATF